VLLPSATLAPHERIGIYHGMYLLRMSEALERDYPALAHFLGEAQWTALVRDYYVERHPSRSRTLNVLGRALPDYLAEAPGLVRRGFCRDLARLAGAGGPTRWFRGWAADGVFTRVALGPAKGA
jgi:hypothetical protein